MNDLRFALRQLVKNPCFTAVAVLTLALGIGANTIMFSILDGTLMRPLRYPESDRLVRMFRTSAQSREWPHSPANFLDHAQQNSVFSSSTAYTWQPFNVPVEGGPAERVSGTLATGGFFETLGVRPAMGRVFTAEDDAPGRDRVAVISHGFWQRRFAGSSDVLKQSVELDGERVAIIGVMPPDFGHRLFHSIDVWKPIGWTAAQRSERGNNYLSEIARLKPGIPLSRAQQEMNAVAARLAELYPGNNAGIGLRVIPLLRSATNSTDQRMLWLASALTFSVLLIACVNLASLQLARLVSRSRELAVRAALGAGRGRMAWQMILESFVLSAVGGGLGLLIALGGSPFFEKHLRGIYQDPGLEFPVNPAVLIFAASCAVLSTVLFGSVPAWLAARADANELLRHGGRGGTQGMAHNRLRQGLIIAEIAFTLTLLCGAGLLVDGLQRFHKRDHGWLVDGLLTAQIAMTSPKYESSASRVLFVGQLEGRITAMPGIRVAGSGSTVPVWGFGSSDFAVEGERTSPAGQLPLSHRESVSPGYFGAMGMRLNEGRTFNSADGINGLSVAIINESMARRFWPGVSALGKRIGSGDPEDPRWEEIIGVVNDIGFPGNLDTPDTAYQVFRPISQQAPRWLTLLLRLEGSSEPIGRALRQVVAELDPTLVVTDIEPARTLVDRQLAHAGLLSRLLAVFAGLGLALAGLGIYGVISYSVAQRVQEFGIRLALGSPRRGVIMLVLKHGLRLSAFGLLIGSAGVFAVSRLLAATVPEVPVRIPSVTGCLVMFHLSVALLACWLPARRAARVDPMVALRGE